MKTSCAALGIVNSYSWKIQKSTSDRKTASVALFSIIVVEGHGSKRISSWYFDVYIVGRLHVPIPSNSNSYCFWTLWLKWSLQIEKQMASAWHHDLACFPFPWISLLAHWAFIFSHSVQDSERFSNAMQAPRRLLSKKIRTLRPWVRHVDCRKMEIAFSQLTDLGSNAQRRPLQLGFAKPAMYPATRP